MVLFKIINNEYIESWADIEKTASFRAGARWNSAGVPAFYASLNPQSAMLEIANYVSSPKIANAIFSMVVFEVPSTIHLKELEPQTLPTDWASMSKTISVQRFGDKYLEGDKYHGIIVPSVTVNTKLSTHAANLIRSPSYSNVVLNPRRVGIDNMRKVDVFKPVYSPAMFNSP